MKLYVVYLNYHNSSNYWDIHNIDTSLNYCVYRDDFLLKFYCLPSCVMVARRGVANSVDTDKTAPIGAVLSLSTLFCQGHVCSNIEGHYKKLPYHCMRGITKNYLHPGVHQLLLVVGQVCTQSLPVC